MKSILLGCFGLLLLSFQMGCCTVGPMGGCGDSCGPGACGVGLFHGGLRDRLAAGHCASGCGEVYWDEQINEPPVCDPCGYGGEFTGGSTCGTCPGAFSRFRQLMGFTYAPSDCDTCVMGPSPVESACAGGNCSSGGCTDCASSGYAGSLVSAGPQQSYRVPQGAAPRASEGPTKTGSPTSRPTPAQRKPAPVPDLEPHSELPPAPNASLRARTTDQRTVRASNPRPTVVGSGVNVRQAAHR